MPQGGAPLLGIAIPASGGGVAAVSTNPTDWATLTWEYIGF